VCHGAILYTPGAVVNLPGPRPCLRALQRTKSWINAGIGDTTTRDARQRLDRDVRRHRPDLVVVHFGINDSWIDADEGSSSPRLTREEYRSNLAFIIRTLKSRAMASIRTTMGTGLSATF